MNMNDYRSSVDKIQVEESYKKYLVHRLQTKPTKAKYTKSGTANTILVTVATAACVTIVICFGFTLVGSLKVNTPACSPSDSVYSSEISVSNPLSKQQTETIKLIMNSYQKQVSADTFRYNDLNYFRLSSNELGYYGYSNPITVENIGQKLGSTGDGRSFYSFYPINSNAIVAVDSMNSYDTYDLYRLDYSILKSPDDIMKYFNISSSKDISDIYFTSNQSQPQNSLLLQDTSNLNHFYSILKKLQGTLMNSYSTKWDFSNSFSMGNCVVSVVLKNKTYFSFVYSKDGYLINLDSGAMYKLYDDFDAFLSQCYNQEKSLSTSSIEESAESFSAPQQAYADQAAKSSSASSEIIK